MLRALPRRICCNATRHDPAGVGSCLEGGGEDTLLLTSDFAPELQLCLLATAATVFGSRLNLAVNRPTRIASH